MVEWANELPEIRAGRARVEFHDLGEPQEPLANEQPSKSGRFIVRSAGDFSDGAPLEWVVRSVLPRAELAVIFGESGSGKSFFALDLCAAVTRGIEWRAKRTVRGGVVYVCAEGARGFKARLKAYAHERKAELAQLPAVIADTPNLREPKDSAALAKAIIDWVHAQGQVDVVVIDTLSATTPGGNENSGEDMGLVLSHCRLISKATGALVILIHHSGKDSTKGARGWSGLRAAADCEIEIVRNGDYRTATITKMKDGEDGAAYPFKLKVVDLGLDSDGEVQSSCVVEHVDAQPVVAGKAKPDGRHQTGVLAMLKVMAPSGTVNVDDLLTGYVEKYMGPPEPGKKDNRKKTANAGLEGLYVKRLAFKHGGDRVSLTSLITTGEGEWLE